MVPAIEPLNNEPALDYVERADALNVPEEAVNEILKQRYGFVDDAEMKKLKLRSKPFWDQFYLNRVRSIHQRGGTRYAALKFVQRKNDFAEERRKLSDAEIERVVDSVGTWPR